MGYMSSLRSFHVDLQELPHPEDIPAEDRLPQLKSLQVYTHGGSINNDLDFSNAMQERGIDGHQLIRYDEGVRFRIDALVDLPNLFM